MSISINGNKNGNDIHIESFEYKTLSKLECLLGVASQPHPWYCYCNDIRMKAIISRLWDQWTGIESGSNQTNTNPPNVKTEIKTTVSIISKL